MNRTILWVPEDGAQLESPAIHREDVELRVAPVAQIVQEAADVLATNELLALPTETVYGLGANALNPIALGKVFQAKGRPQDNPLIAHVSSLEQVHMVARQISELAVALMQRFWPGPLSILLPGKENVPHELTAGLPQVAVRMPNHPLALALITAFGAPVAAPSANQSGRPSPTTASHVLDDLSGQIAGVIDGGACGIGIESTVVAVEGERIVILRPGRIGMEALSALGVEVAFDPYLEAQHSPLVPRSPGQKYRHYAPQGLMTVFLGNDPAKVQAMMRERAVTMRQQGKRVGVLSLHETFAPPADGLWFLGVPERVAEVEHNLYAALRACDHAQIDVILAEGLPDEGPFRAVANRLYKAAGGRVETVE